MKFTIYQPKEINFFSFVVDDDKVDYNKDDYKNMYEGEVSEEIAKESDTWILERLFSIFNISRPDDFKGHSLSTGDIVVLDNQAWIFAMIGWNKINLN